MSRAGRGLDWQAEPLYCEATGPIDRTRVQETLNGELRSLTRKIGWVNNVDGLGGGLCR